MSVYKVVEIIGTSDVGWEDATKQAIATAQASIRDLRVAEVVAQDVDLGDGGMTFRVKLSVSFKYHSD